MLGDGPQLYGAVYAVKTERFAKALGLRVAALHVLWMAPCQLNSFL